MDVISLASRHEPAVEPSADKAAGLLAFLRDYADDRINSRLIDERRSLPPSLVLDMGRAGLLGLQVEEQYGGQGLSHADAFRVMVQTAAIDPNLALLVSVHNAIGIPPVRTFGSEKHRAEVLPQLARGAGLATIAASEPGAGSDLRGITTTATKLPTGEYVLNGAKRWISLGSWASHVTVIAQLEDHNHEPLGITGFLVENGTTGFVPGAEAVTFGMKGIPQNHIMISDLVLDAESRLGEEGQGLAVAQTAFMAGRAIVGAASLGAMKRCLQLIARFAERRNVATGRLLDNGRTQQILNECVAATHAVEALVFHIAAELDQARSVPAEIMLAAKILASELMWQVVDRSVQLLGARGFVETNVVGQYFRDFRLLRIFEGATEAVTGYVGSRIVKDKDGFLNMLRDQFNAPESINALEWALHDLTTRAARGDTPKTAPRQHVLANAIGEIGCWGAMTAVLDERSRATGTAMDAYAFGWCRQHLMRRIRTSGEDIDRQYAYLSAGLLTEAITGYTEAIGDVQQSLAGEDRDLDSLLLR